MTENDQATGIAELDALKARVRELERERKHLLAVIEILQEISGTLNIVDILQGIARKLGESFGLDRCSIFLAEPGEGTARLVASYEDSSIRNIMVNLDQYPELAQSLKSGETVYIPDAQAHPNLKHIKGVLESRRVQSITVVPIAWRGKPVGAIFLRTFKDGPTFSDSDVRFTQVVASLAAKALRNAHRYERALKGGDRVVEERRREDVRRDVMIEFLTRLLATYDRHRDANEERLGESSTAELDRLVDVAMAVFAEEAKGT